MDINSFTAAFTSVEGISAWSTEKKNKARCSKIFLHAHPPSINSYMFGSFWTVPPSTVTALNDRDQVDWLQFYAILLFLLQGGSKELANTSESHRSTGFWARTSISVCRLISDVEIVQICTTTTPGRLFHAPVICRQSLQPSVAF